MKLALKLSTAHLRQALTESIMLFLKCIASYLTPKLGSKHCVPGVRALTQLADVSHELAVVRSPTLLTLL